MDCRGCGASYDSSYSFCPYCGKAKPETPTVRVEVSVQAPSQVEYEYCAIEQCNDRMIWTWFLIIPFHEICWYLRATGHRRNTGIYNVADTYTFQRKKHRSCAGDQELEWLINQLVSEGWENLGRAESKLLWDYRFRRPLKREAPQP